jgi:molybdopterin-guanine dinucleotide biosynthesis protein A
VRERYSDCLVASTKSPASAGVASGANFAGAGCPIRFDPVMARSLIPGKDSPQAGVHQTSHLIQSRSRTVLPGLLLTGGTSRRMGFDKTTIRVDGVPCAERIARVMSAVLHPVIEVGPGHCGLTTVRERPPGSGPLAAMSEGLAELRRVSRADVAVVVVAGDLPFVTELALRMLIEWMPEGCSVVPVVDGRAQPLCARWSVADLDHAEAVLAQGDRSLKQLLLRPDVVMVDESDWPVGVDARTFSDIDTPEDLDRLGIRR